MKMESAPSPPSASSSGVVEADSRRTPTQPFDARPPAASVEMALKSEDEADSGSGVSNSVSPASSSTSNASKCTAVAVVAPNDHKISGEWFE